MTPSEADMRAALQACRDALPIAKSWGRNKGNCDAALAKINRALDLTRVALRAQPQPEPEDEPWPEFDPNSGRPYSEIAAFARAKQASRS